MRHTDIVTLRCMSPEFDESLLAWDDIKDRFHAGGLLIGNGSSIQVSDSFRYQSLRDITEARSTEYSLSSDDLRVFELLNTTDFEEVLRGLQLARVICTQAGHDPGPIVERYESIRRALLAAVRAVHPRHTEVGEERLRTIQQPLRSFQHVFSSNYDLLIYWSIVLDDGPDHFKDYFWGLPGLFFDITDTSTPASATNVYYLHGGLHIFRLPDGRTVKAHGGGAGGWTYTPLLDIGFDYAGAEFPLFVSEGEDRGKLNAIQTSDYLTFAYSRFAGFVGPLAIFGHALAAQDGHLVHAIQARIRQAIRRGEEALVSYAIHEQRPQDVIARKLEVSDMLAGSSLVFFEAASHPLANV